MKKIFLLLTLFLTGSFAAGGGDNIAKKLSDAANTQITEVGKSVASIVNTISITFGGLWIVIMLLIAYFNIEAFKNNAKLLFGALAIIGIVYALSSSMM
jgi:hypothetical protein